MSSFEADQSRRTALTGTAAGLAATTMFFTALSSAYFVRRGISGEWTALELPRVLVWSMVPGITVSITAELARRRTRGYFDRTTKMLLGCGAALAGAFVAMHGYAFRDLAAKGTSAAALFCVMDTALLVLIAGGLVALLSVRTTSGVTVISCYWHYVNVLWILLLSFVQIYN